MPSRFVRLSLPFKLFLVLTISTTALVAAEMASPMRLDGPKIDETLRDDFPMFEYLLERYRKAHGAYPDRLEQLDLERVPRDPWGSSYVYEHQFPDRYVLRSVGANGIDEHGEGDDVIPGPKHYDCKTYAVNCPPAPINVLKMVALLLALVSALGLLLVGPFRFARWPARRLKHPR